MKKPLRLRDLTPPEIPLSLFASYRQKTRGLLDFPFKFLMILFVISSFASMLKGKPTGALTNSSTITHFSGSSGTLMPMKDPNSTYCQGELLNLTYMFDNVLTNGAPNNTPNTYTIELSNDGFSTITNIGRLVSTANSGSIQAVIPYNLGGTGYKIRIKSSNGPLTGLEYGPYTIPSIRPNFTDPLDQIVCSGASINLSTNAGFTSYAWQKVCSPAFVNTTAGLGKPATAVTNSIAKNGSRVFVGTGNGLSISTNSGLTYSTTQLAGKLINDVFVTGNKVYVSTSEGIFLSSDNGDSFNSVPNFDTGNGISALNVNAAAANGSILFAATSGGLSRSTDNGSTFTTVFSDPTFAIFLDGSTVYAATSGGLKISYDDGATFPTTVNSGSGLLPSNNVTAVFVKAGVIYVGTDNGLAISTDGGLSWTKYTTTDGLASKIISSIGVANNLLYIGTDKGLSVGNLGGDGFTTITTGLTNLYINGLVAEASSPSSNIVFLATLGGVAFNMFTLSDVMDTDNNFSIPSIAPSDSWCRFQVKVEKNTCYLTSNQVRVADIPPTITADVANTTKCDGNSNDGRITIKGLVPKTKYLVYYTHSPDPISVDSIITDTLGRIGITFLKSGTYTDVFVKSMLDNKCESNHLTLVINDPTPPSTPTVAPVTPVCLGDNISINVTSPLLNTAGVHVERYRWYTDAGATKLASPSTSTSNPYSPAVPPTESGTIYLRIRDVVTLCNSEIVPVNYTINQGPQISFTTIQPSTSTATDGKITISAAPNPGTGPYPLVYNTPDGPVSRMINSFPYDITGLGVANYTDFKVTNTVGCSSNIINSIPLLGPPIPDVIGQKPHQSLACGITGVKGGYFQQVTNGTCASSNLVDESAGAIAVGRIRQTRADPANPDEKVEMRGYVQFDLSAIPKNATIDKVEFRAKSMIGGFQKVCEVDIFKDGSDNLKFDVTQVTDKNYAPYVGYSDPINADLFDTKYNDFVIGSNATGPLTDLGLQAVVDVQRRLQADGLFEVGLVLAGTDFDNSLYQFNGIVFAPSSDQELCITYHLNDFGDLPEPRYATDLSGGLIGPSHRVDLVDVDPSSSTQFVPALYIGATPADAELDGQLDDNAIETADEDLSPDNFIGKSVLFSGKLIAGEPVTLSVPVTNNVPQSARLSVFIDWNGDGVFNNSTERYDQGVLPATQIQPTDIPTPYFNILTFNINVPKLPTSNVIGVRVRLTTGQVFDAYGPAPDGEVEDFLIDYLSLDYGDLPDATDNGLVAKVGDYQTRFADNGARHAVPPSNPLVFIGQIIDTEVDGQPTAKSTGDDQNPQVGPDDEDGIKFLTPLVPGYTSSVAFTGTNNSNTPAKLYIYTDWTNDGILDLATTYTLPANAAVANLPISFYVPASATFKGGNAFFRFRLTTDADFIAAPSANGVAVDGEVEDYYVPVFKLGNLVWEDRNNNGFQDAEEIQLGIQNVRVVMRFGGINPANGTCDEVTQNTNTNPNTLTPLGAGADIIQDYVIDTFTNAKGLYGFTGMIEGYYQIIALDTFGLTPTRFDWIKNVTEEDRDSDGKPLKNPWDYVSGERRQSKSQQFKLLEGQIGTDEEGILDQGNPQLLDPNDVDGFPDNKVEQRIDFGYVGLDLGDLAESGNNPSVTNFITTENGAKPEGPKHIVTPDLKLGTCQDVEWLGQPDQDAGAEFKPGPDAGGDDPIANFSNYPNFPYDPSQGRRWPFHDAANACGDDEDGIKFLTPMVAGYDAIISVKYAAKINFNGPDAYLHAWIDWNGDGNFDDGAGGIDANEHIIFNKLDGKVVPNLLEANTQAVKLEMSYLTSATDSITLTFKVPADVQYNNGNILARFRISYDPQLGPNGILAPSLNFPDPQPGAGNSSVPGGVIPYGEVEDYFIALSKVGNLVFEDRDYDGFQDDLEPGIPNVPIKLEFAGADGILNNGDPYEFTYYDTTDASGRYYFCGLIGNVDPSGITNPVYRIVVSDPAGMTATFNNPDPSDDACIDDNSNGDDLLIDNRITADTFTITNPMMLCLDENERNDVGGLVAGNNLPPSPDALNNFPDNQYDETRDFGYVGFDYGDLPTTLQKKGSYYQTLRDSMDAKFSGKFGARHAIQPRLYLGRGVDGELNGKPDDDAGSKAGGDDDDQGLFKKGTRTTDDETGVRLLSPLLPGETAYIKVTYTSQDTSGTGTTGTGYVNRTAYLDAFIDWNGNGVMDIPAEKVLFTHQTNSAGALSTNNVPALGTPTRTATLPATGTNGVDSTILAFTVPNDAVFDTGVVFMRFRLGWTNYAASYPNAFPNGLGADNNIFHMTKSPYVKAYQNNLPFGSPVSFNDVAGDAGRYPYPQGEVEDYGIPVAKIGNLAWFDHDVFGDQDPGEDVVDSLHLVLIWGGVDAATGVFDTVGYFKNLVSGGNITDIQYNRTIAPPAVGTYTPGALVKTGISPAPDSGLYSFRGLIPGIYYVLPLKYFATDSATFVNAWPKHRVVTLQDNPGVDDNNDSDGLTSGLPGSSNRPGAMVRIRDGNSRDPEVLVNDRPLNENGKRDADDNASPFTPALFPDNQWDKSVDFGWVDEPNVEANLDIVGVNFPTSQICGNFNVITHLCIKNPQEVPLDSLQMFFNLKDAYGNALYTLTKPVVTIVDSAFVLNPKNIKVRKSSLVNYASAVNAKAKNLLKVNPNYDGVNDIRLLLPTEENKDFLLRGDSILCVQIEFEIDPTKTDKYPWMLQAATTARAIGFNKQTGGKRPLTDFRMFSPRYGKSISVYDLSDEFDDPMPMAGVPYPAAGDGIIFEGMVADRGYKGTYQTPYSAPNVTGRDKYADENDKTIQNDECWLKTKWNAGQHDIVVGLDANCKAIVNGDIVAQSFNDTCGFNKYPMGSYYRVIIQDKITGQTLWASVSRVPFDMSQYLDRQLIYKVRSVSNFCFPVWGDIKLEDKVPPVVTCPKNTDRKVGGTYQFVCTDIDSVLNVQKSWTNTDYAYYTGTATAVDACGTAILDNVLDRIEYFTDCKVQADNKYVYARITRVFTFRDANENKSQCTQYIDFYRPVIQLPACKIEVQNNLAKGDTLVLPKDLAGKYGVADGVPYYLNGAGKRVYLIGKDICGIAYSYQDNIQFITGQGKCGKKIIRSWSLFDWCYSKDQGYPNFLNKPVLDASCYASSAWSGGRYNWEQIIIIGDNTPPVIYALDTDNDKKIGNGYAGAPSADPKVETPTYDPGDVLTFSTGPMDCTGSFVFDKSSFRVDETTDWCYSIQVFERYAVLDLDELPTGVYIMRQNPGVKVTGDCTKGYQVTGVPAKGDWFVEVTVRNACYSQSTALLPIDIVDKIAPVMKCDDQLNVTLDNVGTGYITAKNIDKGSWDNCGPLKWIKVRRPVPDGCFATFLKSWRVIDVNKDGKIGAANNKEDYIDLNRNGKADAGEYFTISAATKMLMTPLMDTIPAYCCDGDSLIVELWGEDLAGNQSYCWHKVKLDDKTPIVCIPPLNVTIKCTDKNFALLKDAKASAKIWGDVLIMSGNTCIKADTAYSIKENLKCGYGTIERIWTLSKKTSKGVIISTCSQIMTVLPVHQYNINFPKDAITNCSKPVIDTVTTRELGCDILAVNVSDKRYNASDDECYKIFRTYTVINWCTYEEQCGGVQQNSTLAAAALGTFVVDRKWSNYGADPISVLVRDLDYLPLLGDVNAGYKTKYALSRDDRYSIADGTKATDGIVAADNDEKIEPGSSKCPFTGQDVDFIHSWSYTQIIKVYDDVRPEVVVPKLAPFCIDPAKPCLATVKINYKAKDNCSNVIEVQNHLFKIAPFQTQDLGAMVDPSTFDKTWTSSAVGTSTDSFSVTIKNLPEGTHDLIVVVRDECGNLSLPTRIPFTVKDCKAPAPICINGLSTDLMPDGKGSGAMTVWARDFIASPIYDCNGQGNPDPLSGDGQGIKDGLKLITKYSINRVGKPKDVNSTSLVVTCDDKNKQVLVEIHAWDEKGNDDFCVTYINVGDNNKVCPGAGSASGDGEIAGLINTEAKQPVQGVSVELSGKSTNSMSTGNGGKYSFTGLQKGYDYSVTPSLDANPLNGVSTFDLVLMQKHILGIEILNSPYKLIAADINNSKSITTLDLILLRKLILNLDTKFTANTSWRFVDASYSFPDPTNPWSTAFPEITSINNLNAKVNANFIAVKIGDVNGNASPNAAAAAEVRKVGKLEMQAEEQALQAGSEYTVTFRARDLAKIQGYQFTMELDRNKVEIAGIDYGVAKAENFGVFKREGVITTSWNRKAGAENGDAILFTLKLKAVGAGNLSEALTVSSRYTANEAYNVAGDFLSVAFNFGSSNLASVRPELLQNTPNPFAEQTQIGFFLPEASEARLTIRDAKGAIVYRLKANYSKGWSQVTIKQSDLKAAGVLYYSLDTPNFTDTKKMVLLNR